MKYKRKSEFVEAFQMTRTVFEDKEFPQWFDKAIVKSIVVNYATEIDKKLGFIKSPIAGEVDFRENDFIINTAGEISSCGPRVFESKYEKVEK